MFILGEFANIFREFLRYTVALEREVAVNVDILNISSYTRQIQMYCRVNFLFILPLLPLLQYLCFFNYLLIIKIYSCIMHIN